MSENQEVIEPLEKKCPRCGAASADSSNPSGRCSACLKKLSAAKKKPGSWQRAQTKADDALRRQKGKNGTAHKKTSGLGSRKSIVRQTQSAEKKTGEKLSPDRKNNGKGYAASNTRMVPEKLNRGRHHVDPKKLAAWKKKLKKSEIDIETLYTLMKAKFIDDPENLELLKSIGPEGLEELINTPDEDTLEKGAAPKLDASPEPTGLAAEIGKTHTVEVHPDMDHLYRAKGLIKENNRPHLHIGDFKKHGFPGDIINKLPRDANGKVTPEMIDKHIESLPKHKVNVHVGDYKWGSQQHRPGDQVALSIQMHPEHKKKMSSETNKLWDSIAGGQHNPGDTSGLKDQIGWSRVDPYSKDNHWHIDEIQSDFQNEDKIKNKLPREGVFNPNWAGNEPGAEEQIAQKNKQIKESNNKAPVKELHSHISHGHEDPQHLIHSATNALARKLGVKSMSMDTPKDQAKQSGLETSDGEVNRDEDHFNNYMDSRSADMDDLKNKYHEKWWDDPHNKQMRENNKKNPNFVSAIDKIGGEDSLREIAGYYGSSAPEELKEIIPSLKKLTTPEWDALNDFLQPYEDAIHNEAYTDIENEYQGGGDEETISDPEESDKPFDVSQLPVHQQQTYHKRPRKLGMKEVDKNQILGEHDNDNAKTVQYMNLHKRLQFILETLRKVKLEESLEKMNEGNIIDKSKFKYKHAKDDATDSHYDVHHDGRLVGQISINKKNNAPSGGQVQPAFHPHLDHISNSVKAFHIARGTKTDN